MSLDDICNVSITASASAPTLPGFGTPMVAVYHTKTANRTDIVTSMADVTALGFAVTDPAYKAVNAIFSQNPRPAKVKIGRRALPTSQTLTLKCLSAVVGDVYKITVGTQTAITYTVLAAATTTSVAAAIAALIAGGGAAAVAAVDTITLTPTVANTLVDLANWSANFKVTDTSADPGLATDLAAIAAYDNDWYGLGLDSNSKAEILAAAAYAEANVKLCCYNNSDGDILAPGVTTDVMSTLKTSAYARTGGLYAGKQLLCYSGCAWMGSRFPFNPGGDTWAFKTLAGVPVDSLNGAANTAVWGKNGNIYSLVAGINITQYGISASGAFFDITRFVDWLKVTIQGRVYTLLLNNAKIPYTDGGVDMLRSTIMGALLDGIKAGGLAASPAPVVTAPNVADVDPIQRALRNLPSVSFTAKLAGAVHNMTVSGVVAV